MQLEKEYFGKYFAAFNTRTRERERERHGSTKAVSSSYMNLFVGDAWLHCSWHVSQLHSRISTADVKPVHDEVKVEGLRVS